MSSQDVKATVLKAGHHGSKTSSSPVFIEAVDPEIAVLSCGQDNKYGHPHFEVVKSLQQAVKFMEQPSPDILLLQPMEKNIRSMQRNGQGLVPQALLLPLPKVQSKWSAKTWKRN